MNVGRWGAKAISSKVDEPFSFVVRHASTGLLEALNEYIANQNYPGRVPTGLTCR
ncbi:MAG TPA: hypothetical protein VGS07_10105 [Thermoanaerobaculia bacterium]|jgi:hypothetical protein|nr:hypothetical protein [Thermoanaerobaculia bacterium]